MMSYKVKSRCIMLIILNIVLVVLAVYTRFTYLKKAVDKYEPGEKAEKE